MLACWGFCSSPVPGPTQNPPLCKTLQVVWRVYWLFFTPQALSLPPLKLLSGDGSNTILAVDLQSTSIHQSLDFLSFPPYFSHTTHLDTKKPNSTEGKWVCELRAGLLSCPQKGSPHTPQHSPGMLADAENTKIYRENILGCFIKI